LKLTLGTGVPDGDNKHGRGTTPDGSSLTFVVNQRGSAMKTIVVAMMAAAALLTAMPLSANTAKADPTRLAQVDVDVRVGGPRGPGVVIDTEGRGDRRYRGECRTVTITEWRDGVRVTRTERRCD